MAKTAQRSPKTRDWYALRRKKRRRRRVRRGMFLASFVILAAALVVVAPHTGVLPAAEEDTGPRHALTPLAEPARSDKPVIAVDPGHGGTDPGTEGSGIRESEMTWRTANALANLLEEDGRFSPLLTISESESQDPTQPRVEPAERTRRAADAGAVLFFSIHGDADGDASTCGFECYAIPPGRSDHQASLSLARLVARGFGDAGARVRGEDGVRYIYFDAADNRMVFESSDESIHTAPTFRILETAPCPAVLAEQCFLTNAADAAAFASADGCQTAAQIYYNAICAWWDQQAAEP